MHAAATLVAATLVAAGMPVLGRTPLPAGALVLSASPAPGAIGWGPTSSELRRARALVGRMSLAQRAGQVLVVSYSGTSPPTALVRELHLGGVIAFAANLTTPARVRDGNRALQRSVRARRGYPLMVGVDQEGGRVARLTTGATRFPSFMTAGAARRPALTRAAFAASAGELADVGFTADFAPVADVTIGARDPTIGSRSAGSRPERVGRQTVAALRGVAASGLLPVLKHFPGHGSVTTDSHLALPVQSRSLATLRARDLVPFRAGVQAHAPAVMVGHLDVRAVDPGVPASLSHAVVTGLLRKQMGFRGLAVTDSLTMRAVSDRFGVAGAAVTALRAGEDVLLMPGSARVARAGIVRAVRAGRLRRDRLDEAATRMVALLLHQQTRGFRPVPAGSAGALSRRLSAAGVTSVAGPCSGRLVGSTVRVTGRRSTVRTFVTAARAARLAVGRAGTTVRLAGLGAGPQTGDVVVATDTPYVLGRSTAPVKIASYGDSPGAMRALVSVLLGRAAAPGRLPVGVVGVARTGC